MMNRQQRRAAGPQAKPPRPSAVAHFQAGIALAQQERMPQAVAEFRLAIRLSPEFAEAHAALANALTELGEARPAITAARSAIALAPHHAQHHAIFATALAAAGDLAAADAAYRAAIERAVPGTIAEAEAHHNRATVLLAQGDYPAGWAEYEWRWRTPPMQPERRVFPVPQWRGEEGDGKTLLIHAEQGFGDTLQFARYIPLAAARGWRVVLEVQKPLLRLLQPLEGVTELIARGAPHPAFDRHCPMLSLPLAFATTLEAIPPPLHLTPPAPDREMFRALLAQHITAGQKNIGIAWAGSPRLGAVGQRRSIDPARLSPLFSTANTRWFSLQKDIASAPVPGALVDLMPEAHDFAATAALIAELDLVLSVDTAVAHLAANLGKPVWLLDRFDPCWRWLTGRDDSPWYPGLRIFRQPAPDGWAAVLATVGPALRAFAAATGDDGRHAGPDHGKAGS